MWIARALSQCPVDDPEHEQADDDQLEEVKNEGGKTTKKIKRGLSFLTQEERILFLTLPDFLKDEIGFEHGGKPYKDSVTRFFDRYVQQPSNNLDHYFDTQIVQGGWAYQSTLVTPSLYRWTFVGRECPTKSAADNSACYAFWNDQRVKEIACKMAPSSRKIKDHVISLQKGPFKKSLLDRDICLATLTKEVTNELMLQFKDMGCRLALWDGNA